jgi:hypothetical protein
MKDKNHQTRLSTKEFQTTLREGMRLSAEKNGWNQDNTSGRGYAFQHWVAEVLCNYDQGIETDPLDSLLFSNDLKADIVLEDTSRKHLIIAQCKYVNPLKSRPIEEELVNDFFGRHNFFSDRDWVEQNGSLHAQEALRDYGDKIADGYSVDMYFVSTGSSSERVTNLAERYTEGYANKDLIIRCYLLDYSGLKDFYVRSLSLDASVPEEVRIQLSSNQWIQKQEPLETVIALIKGNALRNLYLKHKQALFAWNIRGYLGNRSVNKEIIETAKARPSEFFYFSNGVSAICTSLELESNTLVAQNFQIINGAQTVGGLAATKPDTDIDVLFRVTKTKSVKTESGINSDIIRCNNTQNARKSSDFRANDPIQTWIEKSFREQRQKNSLPKIAYQRKRGTKRAPAGHRSIRLEDFAKIRYAYLYEPTLVNASPKDLWSLQSDGGAYHLAFGVDHQVMEVWSTDEFRKALTALNIYFHIEDIARQEGKENPQIKFLYRLRFHALSLAGFYIRGQPEWAEREVGIGTAEDFDSFWKEFWKESRRTLIDVHLDAQEAQERDQTTMHSFVRSAERWRQMKRRFGMHTNTAASQAA